MGRGLSCVVQVDPEHNHKHPYKREAERPLTTEGEVAMLTVEEIGGSSHKPRYADYLPEAGGSKEGLSAGDSRWIES